MRLQEVEQKVENITSTQHEEFSRQGRAETSSEGNDLFGDGSCAMPNQGLHGGRYPENAHMKSQAKCCAPVEEEMNVSFNDIEDFITKTTSDFASQEEWTVSATSGQGSDISETAENVLLVLLCGA